MQRKIIDFALITLLLSVLVIQFIERILPLRLDAERVHIQTLIGSLESALGIKVSQIIIGQGLSGIEPLQNINPMSLLDPSSIPSNYMGEINPSQSSQLEPGIWYFDTTQHQLTYILKYPQIIRNKDEKNRQLSFQVVFTYTDTNNNTSFEPGIDEDISLKIHPMEPIQWAISP